MALTDNLISFWELEAASGSRVDSVVATGNDLTDNNSVTNNTGKVGNAAQYAKASSQYLSHASNASLQGGDTDFSINCWVYLDSHTTYQFFVAKGDSNGQSEYQLYYSLGANKFTWYVENAGQNHSVSDTAPSNGTWYMLTATHDAANNLIAISVNDGTPVSTAHSGGARTLSNIFTVGSDNAVLYYPDGRIDQVGWWRKVLSAAEITSLYNSGAGLSYAAMQGGSAGGPIIGGAIRKGALIRGGRIAA